MEQSPPEEGALVVAEGVPDEPEAAVDEPAAGAVVAGATVAPAELESVDEALLASVDEAVLPPVDEVVLPPVDETDDESELGESVAGAAVTSVELPAVEAAVDEAVLAAVLAAVEAAVDEEAHTVALPGVVVNAVTVKSGVPPFAHVQHGSPNASPLVMLEPGNVAAQKAAVHE
ncbi:hypothetical protein BBJ28_00020810 [Nothophytophthora sp. Chile5]|nr:hypothetical protein BBJ28_00020810 [Nothophytophthora sp. Chile5]